MTPAKPHVVILGAGPAGVGAAYQLAHKGIARVTALERQERVGGNAGSFDLEGVQCDFGSHRLHPVTPPEIMRDLRRLLGDDLLFLTRRGRILLKGHWIHFPLKPVDLLLRLPKSFALRAIADMARKIKPRPPARPRLFPACWSAVSGGRSAASSTFPTRGSCGASRPKNWH